MGNSSSFRWKIERFSAIKEKDYDLDSTIFQAHGYSWKLQLRPKAMAVYLYLEDAPSLPSDSDVEAVFTLHVYNQLGEKHVVKTVKCRYRNKGDSWGLRPLISLEEFQKSSAGFLYNDSCIFGVNILRAHVKKAGVKKARVQKITTSWSECLTILEKLKPESYTWQIDNFSQLERPKTSSPCFDAGGHKWNLRLFPNGEKNHNYLSLYLNLVTISQLPPKSELYAEFKLRLTDQSNGNHMEHSAKERFNHSTAYRGWEEFLPLKDPSKGLPLGKGCTVEATITVLALSTVP